MNYKACAFSSLAGGVFFFILLVLCDSAEATLEDKYSNLLAYYKFDTLKGNVLKDYSGKDYNGDVEGTNFWNREGIGGGSGQFTAGSENAPPTRVTVDPRDTIALSNMVSLTIMLWVKPEKIDGRRMLVSKRAADNEFFYYFLALDDGRPYGGFGTGNDFGFTPRKVDIPVGEWTHLALTLDVSGIISLFINGKLVESPSSDIYGGVDTKNALLSIGSDFEGTKNFYEGLMDEVMIFNTALNEKEIQEQYLLTRELIHISQFWNDTAPFTMAHFPMDEGKGTIVRNLAFPKFPGELSPGLDQRWMQGVQKNVLLFNGKSDMIRVQPYKQLILNESFTILCWIRPHQFGRKTKILFKAEPDPKRFYMLGEHRGTIYGGIGNGEEVDYIRDREVLKLKQWHQVGMIYNFPRKNLELVLDGRISTRKKTEATSSTKNFPLIIGGVTAHYFSGNIQNIRIFNLPLNQELISRYYREEDVDYKAQTNTKPES